jgi:putative transcriptional regulator
MPLNKLLTKPAAKPLKPAVKKPMTDTQLAKWEASRDLEAELLESARQMQRGEGAVVYSPVIAARQNS